MENSTEKTNGGTVLNYKEKKRTEEEKNEAIHHRLEPIKKSEVHTVSSDNLDNIKIENRNAVKNRKMYQRASLFLSHIKVTMSSDKFSDAERKVVDLLREHFIIQDKLAVSPLPEKADELLDNSMALFQNLCMLNDGLKFVQWFEDIIREERNEGVYKAKIEIMKKYAGVIQDMRHALQEEARSNLPPRSFGGMIKKFCRRP